MTQTTAVWKEVDWVEELAGVQSRDFEPQTEQDHEMALSGHILKELALLAVKLDETAHGAKEPLKLEFCQRFDMSMATLGRELGKIRDCNRKQRSDCGNTRLSRAEAELISAYLLEGYRKNSKKITSLKEAVAVLRAGGHIVAGRTDEETGEFFPLSESAISTALKNYVLHPEQLRRDTPCTALRSLHPNHVWQVDASVCVIYYLPNGEAGMVELDQAEHYKNKPENLKAIEQFRVIRYVLTDHTSGLIRFRYYPHAESGEHTVSFLAWAMAAKANKNDHFQGAPLIVMVDPGATSGGLVKRFCKRMNIRLIVNQAHNPRAKGQVEKANHIVETTFEQTLRYMKPRPANFDELNAKSEQYQLWFNATQIHSRTKATRLAVWMLIKPEQLRKTPPADVLLTLATQEPISRVVGQDLTINFKGRLFDVKHVPGVYVKSDVLVHWHPFIADTAMAVLIDSETGHEQHIALPEIKKNEWGFNENAAVINEEFKSKGDTVADTNRKTVNRLAAGTNTLEETTKKRSKKDYTPFDGAIDPLILSKQELPTFMPKRGTELDLNLPSIEWVQLNLVQSAKFMMGRLGSEYDPTVMNRFKQRYPEGATEPEIESFLESLTVRGEQVEPPQLRRVI